ncbi:MAG: flagellar biosynthesis anti-sigma factor FlgM [Candidatus Krumholzibacteriota bacterium]|nr:flagellar biosynthesis anti-sigma factor FlgM [Candidatus Krumholzibacteriota bacterium]
MKINNIQQGKIDQLKKDRDVEEKAKSAHHTKAGKVKKPATEVSRTSRMVSRAKVAAEALSDIREERIAQVKQRMAEGYYDSPEVQEELAAKIAEHLKQIKDN